MAVQWMDNFQQYGLTKANLLNGPYAEAVTVAGTSGVDLLADPDATAGGTTVLRIVTGAGVTGSPWANLLRRVITPSTTVGCMMRVWLTALPGDTHHICKPIWFADSSKNTMVSIQITINGTIQVWRNNTNAPEVLLGESAACIVANAWQHIEAKVVFHASAGTVEVRVDTVPVLVLSGQNTQGSGTTTSCSNVMASNAFLNVVGSGSTLYIKDFAVWDTTGVLNTNFLGSCFVYSMRPDSDVSGTWSITGGAGSAFASINETNPDDDTKYISSPWPAATADILTVSDLPADATSVKALMTYHRSRKSDGGDGNIQTGLVSGGSTGLGSDRPITTAYTYWSDIFETDPATSAQWTVAATNAVKLKLNRTL